MKKSYLHTKKKTQKLTLMMIPNSTSKIRQYAFSYKIIAAAVLALIMLTSMLTFFSTRYFYVNQDYQNLNRQLITLKKENTAQKVKIDYFASKSQEIESRIAKLKELENQITKAIDPKAAEAESMSVVSRSADRDFYMPEVDEADIRFVDELLSSQEKNIDELFDNIQGKITKLEKIPNSMPTEGRLTSPFGDRTHPVTKKIEFHSGIDLANNTGTYIYASATGIVLFSEINGTYGKMILISHGNGYSTVYAHLSKQLVKAGDQVKKGDLIGKMGSTGRSTGPHLHFEIRENGTPIDPQKILVK